MGKHPQLQVAEAAAPDFSAEHFFGHVVPRVLSARRDEARLLGGRVGFIVGAREWVVDLDHGRVLGDRHGSAVQDDDGLELVVRTSDTDFEAILRGQRPARPFEILSGSDAAIVPLMAILSGGAVPA